MPDAKRGSSAEPGPYFTPKVEDRGRKKEEERTCQNCGKTFVDAKYLLQHYERNPKCWYEALRTGLTRIGVELEPWDKLIKRGTRGGS